VTGIAGLPRPIGYVLGGGASLGAMQVGMLQALSEHDIVPDLVAGTSVGSLNGAALALDPTSGGNRLSHVWARMTTAQIFPGSLLAQARTLQHTKTHLFPNTGLAAVIEQFLGGRDRSFEDVVVPFTAVTMDVATGRAHPIRDGPLLPALLASAAVPGIYPRVDHDGRHLYDGGVVANVPMRIAVDMGARSLVVLDCAFPSQLPIPGESFAEIMLFTALVAMRTQAVHEAPVVAQDIPVVYLPGPAPRLISPLDFSHSAELIEASYEAARTFLASLTITGPGLYGSPAP
jgi:NTE family protein